MIWILFIIGQQIAVYSWKHSEDDEMKEREQRELELIELREKAQEGIEIFKERQKIREQQKN